MNQDGVGRQPSADVHPHVAAPSAADAALRAAIDAATAWRTQGAPFAVVRVREVFGVGASAGGELCAVRVDADGSVRMEGSLLGGAADAGVADVARDAVARRGTITADAAVDRAIAGASGISCGPTVSLVAQADGVVPIELWDALRERRPVAFAVGIDPPHPVAVVEARRAVGALVGDRDLLDRARALLASGVSSRAQVATTAGPVAVETFVPAPTLLLVGRTSLALVIADLARSVGWNPALAEDAADVVAAVGRLRTTDALVVLSHQDRIDEITLVAALRTGGPDHVAALGSRAVAARRRSRLLDLGVDPSRVASLRSPAGLRLGGTTASDIALSIVAELQAHRYGEHA